MPSLSQIDLTREPTVRQRSCDSITHGPAMTKRGKRFGLSTSSIIGSDDTGGDEGMQLRHARGTTSGALRSVLLCARSATPGDPSRWHRIFHDGIDSEWRGVTDVSVGY